MAYEIDFIGLKGSADDADAIAMRWKKANDDGYIVGVIDGGFTSHGEALVEHLNNYYFKDTDRKIIDFVICTHADQDHASGLIEIINNFEVNALYMNIPWNYIDELLKHKKYWNTSENSLRKKLKTTYSFVDALEQAAREKGVEVYEAFAGTKIEDKLTVLSPEKAFFIESIINDKNVALLEMAKRASEEISEPEMIAAEWDKDDLYIGKGTTPVNEASIVIFGDVGEGILLTGDAGVNGLNKANKYANTKGINLADSVKVYKIPHHGSRRNLDTETMNNIVGPMVKKGGKTGKYAFVMCGETSDHPKKVIVNAFIRRGVDVFVANRTTVTRRMGNMPDRAGWTYDLEPEVFNDKIEKSRGD